MVKGKHRQANVGRTEDWDNAWDGPDREESSGSYDGPPDLKSGQDGDCSEDEP